MKWVPCFQPRAPHARPLCVSLLQRVTCESDSQGGPHLPAVPGGYDSSPCPVTHTARLLLQWSTSLETWQPQPSFFSPLQSLWGEFLNLQGIHPLTEELTKSLRGKATSLQPHSESTAQQRRGAQAPWHPAHPCLFLTVSPSPGLPRKGG